ncbi:hypothetical protein IFVP5_C1380329 [Vibrio parahaemolyticus]
MKLHQSYTVKVVLEVKLGAWIITGSFYYETTYSYSSAT